MLGAHIKQWPAWRAANWHQQAGYGGRGGLAPARDHRRSAAPAFCPCTLHVPRLRDRIRRREFPARDRSVAQVAAVSHAREVVALVPALKAESRSFR